MKTFFVVLENLFIFATRQKENKNMLALKDGIT